LKLAFISGGSSGIGLALARRLVARGTSVCIAARDPARLADARVRLEAARGGPEVRVEALPLDVTDPQACRDVFATACARLGDPDLVVACAGRAQPRAFADVDDAQFDAILRVNLHGTRNLAAASVDALTRTRGAFVAVSSLAGLIGVYGYTDYCAAKAGVIGFADALRQELRPLGVRVHALCPPDTDTPGLEAENRTKPDATRAISAGARVLRAEQVADALLAGLGRDRLLILPGLDAHLVDWARRLAPELVRWWTDRVVRRAALQSFKGSRY